jgi:hypothetical protein
MPASADRQPQPTTRERPRRPHPIVFSGAIGFTLFVALVVTLLIRHNDLPPATDWRIVGWGTAIALAGWVVPLFRWRHTWIDLDGERLRWATGRWRTPQVDVDLSAVRGLAIEQGWLGRHLDYARLRLVDEAGREHAFPAARGVEAYRRAAGRCGRGGARSGDRRRP